jgi:hypothetical protein
VTVGEAAATTGVGTKVGVAGGAVVIHADAARPSPVASATTRCGSDNGNAPPRAESRLRRLYTPTPHDEFWVPDSDFLGQLGTRNPEL